LEDFELEFVGILQTNHNLGEDRSSEVARIMTDVVQQYAGHGDSLGSNRATSRDRFTAYLHAAFEGDANEEAILEKEDGSLQDQWSCQQEEILFLRSTLKALARSKEPSPSLPHKKCNGQHIDVDEPFYTEGQRHQTREACSQVFKPDIIQLHRVVSLPDDHSDASSILSDVASGEERLQIVAHEEELGASRHQRNTKLSETEREVRRTHHGVAHQQCDLRGARNLRDEKVPILPTMANELPTSSIISFPEMSKGDICNNRARCVLHEIYFEKWGMTLRGHYSGMVRDQQPHGSGVLRFGNGDFYCGQFECGLFQGEGSLLLRRDGRLLKYRGHFFRNEFVGT
jgi:hypothetical protein